MYYKLTIDTHGLHQPPPPKLHPFETKGASILNSQLPLMFVQCACADLSDSKQSYITR